MSTAAPPTTTPQAAGRERSRSARSYELQVPRDEKVASMLIAMVIFVTVLVAALFVVWLTYQIFRPVETVPMASPMAKGGPDDAFGNNDDIEPPGVNVAPELSQPTIEDTQQRIMDAVGSVSAAIDNYNLKGEGVAGGQGLGGRGDDKGRGDGGDVDAIPRYERWKINFAGRTLDAYARQLDHFKIELAVSRGRGDEISYASGFANGKLDTRSGTRKFERRSRFEWESGTLRESDRQLLNRALESDGMPIIGAGDRWMQYYDPDELKKMDHTEKVYYEAAGHSLAEVLRTVFKVKTGDSGGYEFYVFAQTYRVAPK